MQCFGRRLSSYRGQFLIRHLREGRVPESSKGGRLSQEISNYGPAMLAPT